MLKIHGKVKWPASPLSLQVAGICPYCKKGAGFKIFTQPNESIILTFNIKRITLSYYCDLCLSCIPIDWLIQSCDGNKIEVARPLLVIPAKENFDFNHVPEKVNKEINEALDCLSVNSYNGFAALCRRAIQAICVDLGAKASARIKKQIGEMSKLSGLDADTIEITKQIMLSGHDGSHPHLPDVTVDRASILLSLLQDLTYEIYTRSGNIKKAAELRKKQIEEEKTKDKDK